MMIVIILLLMVIRLKLTMKGIINTKSDVIITDYGRDNTDDNLLQRLFFFQR